MALMLLALFCPPSCAAPSAITVVSHDMADVTSGDDECLLTVSMLCNAEPYDDYGAYFTTFTWNKGTYNAKKKKWSNFKYPAKIAGMPDDPKSFFGAFIPKAWTGPVSIDVYARIEMPYEGGDNYFGPNIDDPYNLYKDGILKFAVNNFDGVSITDKTSVFPLWANDTQLRKTIIKTKGGDFYDLDIHDWTGNQYRAVHYPYAMELNASEDFPLTLYTISLSTLQHKISVASTDAAMGSISPATDQMAIQGEDAAFFITAKDGYRIAKLLIDGKSVEIDDIYACGYTFKQVDAPHTIAAEFEEFTNAPVISADESKLTVSLADYVTDEKDSDVAALGESGYVSGAETVNIVGSGGSTKTGGKFTRDGFVCAVKLNVKYDDSTAPLMLTVKPESGKTFDKSKSYHALLLNKTTNYYDLYPATLNADGNLTMTIKPVGDYFSTGTIFVYSGTAKETGDDPTPVPEPTAESKSSSGCNAGMAALALLALVPLLDRRKK